jgi:fucose 4-O-acetylase-like acetyltransferase
VVDALTWWINSFIMPLFLLLGGFVAAQLMSRHGPGEFLRHRTRRLLWPFVFGCVVILPLDLYIWLLGWANDGRIPLKKLRSLKLGDAGRDLWGVGHLWFLQYLLLFCVAAWAAHHLATWWTERRQSSGAAVGVPRLADRWPGRFKEFGGSFWTPILLAAPSAAALWYAPRIVIGFRHAWLPLPANLVYYAPCFAGGWWLFRRVRRGDDVTRHGAWHLILSLVCFVALLPLLREHVVEELTGARRVLLAGLFAGGGWLAATGWFALALKPRPPAPGWVRYLAEASLWVYLFHHPVVGLAQVALAGSRLPAGCKFVLVTLSGVALSLLTYEVGVRRTWVGRLLHGPRGAEAGKGAQSLSPIRRAA